MNCWDQSVPGDLRSSEGTWEKLSHVAVKGAVYDSRERQPHPKCLEGTRVDLLNYIHGLLDNREKSQLIWLHGTAGVGKSAVAFTVAERMRGLKVTEQTSIEKRLAGTFFFSRKHTNRSMTGYFFPTLAYQLASTFPSVREDVNRVVRENPALLDPDSSLREQMDALFLRPLLRLRFRLRECPPLSFVVDALDECTSETELADLISLLGQALREPDLPLVHILLTSRSEAHIREAMQEEDVCPLVCEIPVKISGEGVASIISLDGTDVDNDICIFLEHSFRKLRGRYSDFPQPTRSELARLASRAGRRFIVASTTMKFIDDEYNDPRDRLHLMLELTSDLLPGTEVYKLYDSILSTCTNPNRAYFHLSVVAALTNPLPISQISKLLGPGQGRDVEIALVQLRSIMDIPTDSSLPVNIYHSSVRDYVSSPSNCSLPDVQYIMPHPLLAFSSFRLMMQDIPESTALLDGLSELKRQSKVMQSDDPQTLKQSLASIVHASQPVQVPIGLLWLWGDRSLALQSWLQTQRGNDWLLTLNGQNWLQTQGGGDWVQTIDGQQWLQTEDGRVWLPTQAGRDWLNTLGGQYWLQNRAGQWWWETQVARDFLQTQGGQDWLQTQGGKDWLQRQRGKGWLETQGAQKWLQTWGAREWLQARGAQEWLQTQDVDDWLETPGGRAWLATQSGRTWLQTQGGGRWLQTPKGRHWLQTPGGRYWLQNQRGRYWSQTPVGRESLQTQVMRSWLQTQGGQEWLQTQRGQGWLQSPGGEFWLLLGEGQKWLQTQGELDWLRTQGGREWLRTHGGRSWLQTRCGRVWLWSRWGEFWLLLGEGQTWLQTQEGDEWLKTDGRGWLRTESGKNWLRTNSGEVWLKTQSGKDWLQTPCGQASRPQAAKAQPVWIIMEELLSTLEALGQYTIIPELPLLPAFQAIQHFKTLPDFLVFPVFLALWHRNYDTYDSPQGHLPDMEIIHIMKTFANFANETRQRSRSASDALKYACQNWAAHLARAPDPWDDMLIHIFKSFWNRNLLSWLETQWCSKGLRSCLPILSEGERLANAHL